MAKVTNKQTGVVFTLEISAAEAQYVAAALQRVEPTHLGEDEVYDVLTDSMHEAGVPLDSGAARG